jgi:uncharacterized protein (TIGR02646 family)
MLKVQRPLLPASLQDDLARRQAAVDNGTAGDSPWKEFRAYERKQALRSQPTVKAILIKMFHGKCAYCESKGARDIEHYWPKSPHAQNVHRGSPAVMFRWDNLLWACHICNGFECKASRMEWNAQGEPKLLNPCTPGHDPFCHIEITLNMEGPQFALGWMEPYDNLNLTAYSRAEYTIRRLKLNHRDELRQGRAKTIRDFFGWLKVLRELGPDYEAPLGYTVRQRFVEFLDPTEPYLASVRQILITVPALGQELLNLLPELATLFTSWALPPDDCRELEEYAQPT